MKKINMSNGPFIPNSYLTPNAYCDDFMYLLDPQEWKVLSYAVRRIFGFNKRQDHISLSQFVHGTFSTIDGRTLDHGTGLSKPTVIRCLDSLMYYRLMCKLADNDPTKNEGDLYSLQLEYERVDYDGLIERANKRASADLKRTAAGRNSAESKRRSIPLIGQSDLPANEPVNGIDQHRSMGLTSTGQWHLPQPVNGIDTQYTVGKTEEIKVKGISHPDFEAACARLKSAIPIDYEQAGPVLLEADERPNRMLIKLSAVPAGFMDAFKSALEQVTRRRYAVSFETPGTGRAVALEIDADPPSEADDPIGAADLELWKTILDELRVDIQPATYRAYIAPAHPVSVNGDWTIAVPSVTWWRMHMPSALRRIYKGLTGHDTTFVFQDMK